MLFTYTPIYASTHICAEHIYMHNYMHTNLYCHPGIALDACVLWNGFSVVLLRAPTCVNPHQQPGAALPGR